MSKKDLDAARIATCVDCSCTDVSACPGGCAWTEVDREDQSGLCSRCSDVRDLLNCLAVRVQSSQFTQIRWSQALHKMLVWFTGESVYLYANVDQSVAQGIIRAESAGSYFYHEVKKKKDLYPYERVDLMPTLLKSTVEEFDKSAPEPASV